MALYTEAEIKESVAQEWSWIKDRPYPQDVAGEFADSAVPIWTAEIQTTWCELDFEHQNTYKTEQGMDTLPDSIEDLMRADLYYYYWQLYSSAIEELERAEQDQQQEV
jgi:hypothetical protein